MLVLKLYRIWHDYSSTQPTLLTSPMILICNQARYSVRTAAAFRWSTDFDLQLACDYSRVVCAGPLTLSKLRLHRWMLIFANNGHEGSPRACSPHSKCLDLKSFASNLKHLLRVLKQKWIFLTKIGLMGAFKNIS